MWLQAPRHPPCPRCWDPTARDPLLDLVRGWGRRCPRLGSRPQLSPRARMQAQLAVAAAGCEAEGLQQQRCEPGARQPAEPLAGPATVLTPGGESCCRDGAEGTVSAPVTRAAGLEVAPDPINCPPWGETCGKMPKAPHARDGCGGRGMLPGPGLGQSPRDREGSQGSRVFCLGEEGPCEPAASADRRLRGSS